MKYSYLLLFISAYALAQAPGALKHSAEPLEQTQPELHVLLYNFMQGFYTAEPADYSQPEVWHAFYGLLHYGAQFQLAGVDINLHHQDTGVTALHCATKLKMRPLIRLLLQEGARPNRHDTVLMNTPLHLAAQNNDIDAIIDLCNAGAQLNARNYALQTPLHTAVLHNNTFAVAALCLFNADTTIPDQYGKRPLRYAQKRSYRDISTLLTI